MRRNAARGVDDTTPTCTSSRSKGFATAPTARGGAHRSRTNAATRLGKVAKPGTAIRYVYDFGDDWEHNVVVEQVLSADRRVNYPTCVAGKRACPPEGCGGVWGYQEFVAAIADPGHPQHEEMLEWVGGNFDPEAFEADEVSLGGDLVSRPSVR